jgi:hypothetical protein
MEVITTSMPKEDIRRKPELELKRASSLAEWERDMGNSDPAA